jgi:hypothetical protein
MPQQCADGELDLLYRTADEASLDTNTVVEFRTLENVRNAL